MTYFCFSVSKEPRKLFRLPPFKETFRHLGTIETPTENRTVQKFIPKGILGQPTCHTHPHLIPEDHLTHGIMQAEYKERRERLVSKLAKEMENVHTTHIVSYGADSLLQKRKLNFSSMHLYQKRTI